MSEEIKQELEEQQELVAPAEEPVEAEKPKNAKKEKKKLTKEQKKKKTIKGLIIAGSILLALAIFISSCAIANEVGTKGLIKQGDSVEKVVYSTERPQLTKANGGLYKDQADGYWTFVTDRDFKVVQITDVHIGGGCFSSKTDAWALNAVATMVRQEQPDLVVVTGDIAYPVPFQAGTFNNLHATQIFSNMMEHLGVYWTFAFGNHDTEIYGTHNKQDILKYYEDQNYEYCLFGRNPAIDDTQTKDGFDEAGAGNNIIKVKNSAGIVTQAIVVLDSHSYFDGDYLGIQWKYDNLHQCQVDWYVQEMDKIRAANVANGGADAPVKNMAYFHIPLVEYRDAWKQVVEKKGEIKNEKLTEGEVISADVTYYYGVMGENYKTRHGVTTYGVFCGYREDNFFEEGLTHGLQAVFCGHDHYNNFSISYKGIRLTYGMSIDYLAYAGIFKEHSQRGCTVITIKNDGTFTSTPKNYYRDYEGVSAEKGDTSDIMY
ncbi:MAG: metallophosphoesterase [Clostridia bacterium]|nr:metallophosphoesterase [Clostridia bacterium]